MDVILLLFLLLTKHFIVDFPLQNSYQYLNKGTWLHLGGILHSSLHGIATGLIMSFFTSSELAIILALMDLLVHYAVDFSKVKINKHFGLAPSTHEQFWWLLGFDQWLHNLTYLAIVYFVQHGSSSTVHI